MKNEIKDGVGIAQIDHKYVYVFVRSDLSVEQQLVQAGHAALEAGIFLGDRNQQDVSSLIVLKVKNKYQLEKALAYIKNENIETVSFYESDYDVGFTAFATRPVVDTERYIFKKYNLWKLSQKEVS